MMIEFPASILTPVLRRQRGSAERMAAYTVAYHGVVTGYELTAEQLVRRYNIGRNMAYDILALARSIAPTPASPPAREWGERDGHPYVYFIQAGSDGMVKIGYSLEPHARRRALQSDHAEELRIIGLRRGGQAHELTLHRRFAKWRVHGEWFHPVPEILAEAARQP